MSFLWTTASLVIAFFVLRISHWWYRWSNPKAKCIGKLPPGSMGFPIIGETIDFFKPCGFFEISSFLKKRVSRYGPLFRTNIFGSKTVFATDPEVIFEILRQEDKNFVISYPDMFIKAFGKGGLLIEPGNIHKYMKQLTLHLLGTESLKRDMIGKMDQAVREHLISRAGKGTFSVWDTVFELIMETLTPKVISNLKPGTQKKFMANLAGFNHDWFESPFALSTWKAFIRVLRARRDGFQVIKDSLTMRKESKERHDDFLDTILEEIKAENTILDDKAAVGLIFAILGVAKETTPIITALAVQFLSKNPKALAELKGEHIKILQNREDKECGVSWEEYRHNMSFTNKVISESLRLANFAPVHFRKAIRDVEISGYTIPEGWIVAVAPPLLHYNATIYENPLEFNPWRWEGKEMVWGSKTFMVFGGGVRLCVGSEFARLQMALFLHHLVTTYDFSVVQDCELVRKPMLQFTKSLLIHISESSK